MSLLTALMSSFGLFPKRKRLPTPEDKRCPVIVFPRRQYVTAGDERSIDIAEFGNFMFSFYDRILNISSSLWKPLPIKEKVFGSLSSAKVNRNSFRAFTYPTTRLHGERELPLILYEFDLEDNAEDGAAGSRTPQKCFEILRQIYFAENVIDDEGTFHLLEHLPDSKDGRITNQLVFKYVWDKNPRKGFAKRDWVEYIGVDEETLTIVERSCLHPLCEEAEVIVGGYSLASALTPPLFSIAAVSSPSTFLKVLLSSFLVFILDVVAIILPVGTVRASAINAIRFLPPKEGKTGCRVQQLQWNSMGGVPDVLMNSLPSFWDEYVHGVAKSMSRLEKLISSHDAAGYLPNVPFDLFSKHSK